MAACASVAPLCEKRTGRPVPDILNARTPLPACGVPVKVPLRPVEAPRVVFLSSIGAETRHGAGFVDGLRPDRAAARRRA